MKTYDFTVYIRGLDYMSEDAAEALYEAGCDDCLAGSSGGQSHAAFAREATSLESAVASAAADIRKAGFDVDRVEINDVSQLEIGAA